MRKMTMNLMIGALSLAMLVGTATLSMAQDGKSGGKKPKEDKPKAGADVQKEKDDSKAQDFKQCKGLGCKVPKCIHDWSQYKLDLTPEQKNKVEELRDKINKDTAGMNWCTLAAARHNLLELKKHKNPDKVLVEKAQAEVKRIKAGIEAGRKEFDIVFASQILNVEQQIKYEARKKAEKEHRELCNPKHHPSCPFYRKDKVNNEGGYMQYCQEKEHLSQGIFNCPGYKEDAKDEKKSGKPKEPKK